MRTWILFTVLLSVCFCTPTGTQAQWRQVHGPFGTNIRTLFTTGTTVLATTPAGIYRSTDNGATWTQTSPVQAYDFVRAGTTLYAGVPTGLLVSTDDGQTWAPMQNTLPEAPVYALAFDGTTLFVGTGGTGVLSSTDNGATWLPDNEGLPNGYVSSMIADGGEVYLGLLNDFGVANGGIFRRNGTRWTATGLTGISEQALARIGTTLLAGDWNVIYRSTDNGATWTTHTPGTAPAYTTSFVALGTALFAGTSSDGVVQSTDNGETWQPAGLPGVPIRTLAVAGSTVLAGSERYGLFASHDGGATWVATGDGLPVTANLSLLATDGTTLAAVAEQHDYLYTSDNGGTTWRTIPRPAHTAVTAVALLNSALIAGTSVGIFTTDLHGSSWHLAENSPLDRWVNTLYVHGTTLLAGVSTIGLPTPSNNGILYSEDIGLSWTASAFMPPVFSFTRHNGALYAGTAGGVAVSTDGGKQWKTLETTGAPFEGPTFALASNGSTLFAGLYDSGIVLSHDNGATWVQATTGFSGVPPVQAFAVHEQTVFAACSTGVFRTIDNGATWEAVSTGMEGIPVLSLVVDNGYLYAGTVGAALWRRPLAELVVTAVDEQTAGTVPLLIAPHPLTSSSTLLHADGHSLRNAVLTISTVTGQTVYTAGGLYGPSIQIRRETLAPGVYLAVLSEEGRRIAATMIVVQ